MTPSFSIVIEMENALRAENERFTRTLRALREQIAALDPPPPAPEILIPYDGRKSTPEALDRLLADVAHNVP